MYSLTGRKNSSDLNLLMGATAIQDLSFERPFSQVSDHFICFKKYRLDVKGIVSDFHGDIQIKMIIFKLDSYR